MQRKTKFLMTLRSYVSLQPAEPQQVLQAVQVLLDLGQVQVVGVAVVQVFDLCAQPR